MAAPNSDLLAKIEEELRPLLGETLARASLRAQKGKLGISDESTSKADFDRLIQELAKGMKVFVGADRTASVVATLEKMVEGAQE